LVDLPNTLIDLPNLKRLDLQNNEETLKKIPNNIINMKRLECLYINSKTSKTFMENLESFENLKELSLVEFKFNFSHYVNLKVITKLILHDCKMSKIPNNILLLSNLRELWLTKNNLKKIPNSINLLSHLVILKLKDNRIKRIPPKIGDMTYLKELDLSFNRITKIPIELYHSNTLEKLNLKKNLIKVLPKQFAAIKSLKELDLSYNNLLEIPKEIYELENLEILNLQYNTDIITINPKICCLEKLEHLKIFDFDIPISILKEHDYEYDV